MTVTERPHDQYLLLRQYWTERGWGADDHVGAFSLLAHVPRLVYQFVDRVLEPLGLTGSRHALLVAIDCSTAGALSIGELSRRIVAHPTSVTKLVQHLEAGALVRRRVPEHDRRAVIVELTADGRAVLEQAGGLLAASKLGLGALGADDLGRLIGALELLRADLMDPH